MFPRGAEASRLVASARKRWNEEDLKKSMISLFRGSGVAKLGRMKEQAEGEVWDRVNNRFSCWNTGENLLLHRSCVTY